MNVSGVNANLARATAPQESGPTPPPTTVPATSPTETGTQGKTAESGTTGTPVNTIPPNQVNNLDPIPPNVARLLEKFGLL